MLSAMIQWAIARRWLVIVGAIVLTIWIFRTIIHMPLDVFPTFAPPQVEVQTEAPGLAPEEVESLVPLPIAIGNGTNYALTGGLYSRTPSHIEQAEQEFEVGNLYINRGITGAIVASQPFGGFKLSGVGSKAGGPITCCNSWNPESSLKIFSVKGSPRSKEQIDRSFE